MDIFTVNLFSLYSRLVNNREIKLTLIIQRQLQYYSISAAIVKINTRNSSLVQGLPTIVKIKLRENIYIYGSQFDLKSMIQLWSGSRYFKAQVLL